MPTFTTVYEKVFGSGSTYATGGVDITIPFAYRVVNAYPLYVKGSDAKIYMGKVVSVTKNKVKVQIFYNVLKDRNTNDTIDADTDGDEYVELANNTDINGFRVGLFIEYEK